MAAELLRVALLARPGIACDRLRDALDEAGARRVLEADPTALELPALVEASPQVVLVALDPAIEDVLGRFDEVLFDPTIDVIYEEAELAASREGWDVARWQRHLVAKLQRHGDVLPPGREPDDLGAGDGESDPVDGAEPGLQSDEVAVTPLEVSFEPVAGGRNPFDPVQAESDDEAPGAGDSFAVETSAEMGASSADGASNAPDPTSQTRFGELSLDGGAATGAVESHEANHKFKHDLNELERRISGLELVDDTPVQGPEQARGAVLVLAGIGGPDAVRQLLGGLLPDFARPVLVQQRLDGARHDKLVAQMQRATSLPVILAEPGQPAQAGSIYILPASVGIEVDDAGIRFNHGGDALAALPSADSAVLLLSGSDPEQVDAAMKHSWAGALVAGQAADGCYDAVASNALAARGGDTASASELAKRLSERWP